MIGEERVDFKAGRDFSCNIKLSALNKVICWLSVDSVNTLYMEVNVSCSNFFWI